MSKPQTPQKRFPITLTCGDTVHVSQYEADMILRARYKASRINCVLQIYPTLQFNVVDKSGNYIIGSNDVMYSLIRINSKLEKELRDRNFFSVHEWERQHSKVTIHSSYGKEIRVTNEAFGDIYKIYRDCRLLGYKVKMSNNLHFSIYDRNGYIAENLSLPKCQIAVGQLRCYKKCHNYQELHDKAKDVIKELCE